MGRKWKEMKTVKFILEESENSHFYQFYGKGNLIR